MAHSTAWKRYSSRIFWLSLTYAAVLPAALLTFKYMHLRGVLAYFVAVLAALPILGIFAAIGRYLVEEQDEYVRMLMVRQTLWASGFVLSLATVWGFLENFGLARHIDAYWIGVFWLFGLGIGAAMNRIALGAPVRC
jgi:hypothetical protein